MAKCPRPPRIYADQREQGSGVPEALTAMGAIVLHRRLAIGDYVVSDRVAVERKTLPDLAKSLFDGRLFDQARRLAEHYEKPVLVVEGDPTQLNQYTTKTFEAKMALTALALDHGVAIVYTESPAETARLIYHLACREQYQHHRVLVAHQKPRLDQLWQQQLYLLQALPGIGPQLAHRLLKKYKTIEAICKATQAELALILGEARAKKVYQVLHQPYNPPTQRRQDKTPSHKTQQKSPGGPVA